MKQKVLMLASVASMIDQFNMPNIRLLQDLGYEVHVVCNFKDGNTCDDAQIRRLKKTLRGMQVPYHQWDCPRDIRPLKKCRRAYVQLCRLMEQEQYAWMHCHSPVGGALARLAAHRAGVPVIYTAHGFHFYKGAPFKNWLLYYPAEKLLACWTDVLITINKEDYRLAQKKFRAKKVCYTPGVGIDIEKYAGSRKQHNPVSGRAAQSEAPASWTGVQPAIQHSPASGGADEMREISREQFLRNYKIPENALVLLSAGELSRRKNHRAVLEALAGFGRMDVYYLICGQGPLREALGRQARKLGIADRVRFCGFQQEMEPFYRNADIFVLPSLQEGMPAALMEAMAAGLPCIVSDIRGNRELVDDAGGLGVHRQKRSGCSRAGGARFACGDTGRLKEALQIFADDPGLRRACGMHNRQKIRGYGLKEIEKRMRKIYAEAGKQQEKSGSRKTRVLHVLKSGAFAGAERVAAAICQSLQDQYETAYASPDGEAARHIRDAGIAFYPMERFSFREIRRICREFEPDIIHAHDFSASVFCAALKKDRFLTAHLHNNPRWIKKWTCRSIACRLAVWRMDRILVVSDAVWQEAVFLRRKDPRIFVAGNPTDAGEIRRKSREFCPQQADLLFAGRLERQKNPQRFIRIAGRLAAENPGLRALMIGSGGLEAECRRLIRKLGMEKQIRMAGFCRNPYPYIRRAKMLLVTSDWEGYGLAAAEAAVLHTPVLAAGVGGLCTIFGKFPQALCGMEERQPERRNAGRLPGAEKRKGRNMEQEMYEKAGRLLQDGAYYSRFCREMSRKVQVLDAQTYMEGIRTVYKEAAPILRRRQQRGYYS